MLKLSDFHHDLVLDQHIAKLAADEPGLVVVAGASSHSPSGVIAPSGRVAMFRILVNRLLEGHADTRALVVSRDKALVRVPAPLRSRIELVTRRTATTYADQIRHAAERRPALLVVDQLDAETTVAALEAAASGLRVLAQVDTLAHGDALAPQLQQYGASASLVRALHWVLAVQRVRGLCPTCCAPIAPQPELVERLHLLNLDELAERGQFAHAPGCDVCGFTGRSGELFLFDLFHNSHQPTSIQPRSVLTFEAYGLRLAADGRVAVEDVLYIESGRLAGAYRLVAAGEEALAAANRDLQRKVVQLESANRVLEQRTAALMSLQEISHQLITTESAAMLASRICRAAGTLCGADRVVVYLLREAAAEILAVSGWDTNLVGTEIGDMAALQRAGTDLETPFLDYPPGVPVRHADVEGGSIRHGIAVPLVVNGRQLGAMIVQSLRRHQFDPADVILLQTFAGQAALALQRANLVDELRQKVAALEAAQAALAARERLERELELAREVQQSVLPRVFPRPPGYAFAARNQPAREVGGDFYDVFLLDDARIGVVIGDVSGKGMPAALYMALARSLIFAEALREASPVCVLRNVNRLLRQLGEPHLFVTVCYGVLTPHDGRFVYCRAGHDYPLLLRDGNASQLQSPGTVLGFFDNADLNLSEDLLIMQPGDRLVLYTDGLTDVLDASGTRYSLEQLEEMVCGYAGCSAAELIEETFAALALFQGQAEQFDDMTMLVIEVS